MTGKPDAPPSITLPPLPQPYRWNCLTQVPDNPRDLHRSRYAGKWFVRVTWRFKTQHGWQERFVKGGLRDYFGTREQAVAAALRAVKEHAAVRRRGS